MQWLIQFTLATINELRCSNVQVQVALVSIQRHIVAEYNHSDAYCGGCEGVAGSIGSLRGRDSVIVSNNRLKSQSISVTIFGK